MKSDRRPWIAISFLSCALALSVSAGCQIAYADEAAQRCSALLHRTVQVYESAKYVQTDFFLDSGFLPDGPSSGTIVNLPKLVPAKSRDFLG